MIGGASIGESGSGADEGVDPDPVHKTGVRPLAFDHQRRRLDAVEQAGVQANHPPPVAEANETAVGNSKISGRVVEKYVQGGGNQATYNVDFAGEMMDARSWSHWCAHWLELARQQVKPGGYAVVFTDWRQLPALTDAIQIAGWHWRGVAVWDKGAGARGPHKGYFRHQCEYIVWASNGPLPAATHGGPWPGCYKVPVVAKDKLT